MLLKNLRAVAARTKYLIRRRKVVITAVTLLVLSIAMFALITGRNGGMESRTLDPATALSDPAKKDIAMQLVSSAENSSLDWKDQYGYIEWDVEANDAENRGYTGGLIGFCSGCGDMTELVERYGELQPNNRLQRYLPALRLQQILGMGHVTQEGLGQAFVDDWQASADDAAFRQAQDEERDRTYFDPAVSQAQADGLHALGQFMYYDAIVMHGPGDDANGFQSIRTAAIRQAKPPAQGGDEKKYLQAFLQARKTTMKAEQGHSNTSRVDDMQQKFLDAGNLGLVTPLRWSVYGDDYAID